MSVTGSVNYGVIGSGWGDEPTSSAGGGRTPVEDADTLQSRANLKLIDLIGEGQIGGLVDGARSIILNGTPLMNAGGEYNFSGVTWSQRVGTPNQSIIPGFSSIESPVVHGEEITATTHGVFTITNINVDRVRVIVNVPSLMSQNTATGDLHGTSVSYHLEVSKDGEAPVQIGPSIVISGKTKAKYQKSAVITLPKPVTTGWTINVVRETTDSASASLMNKTYLDSHVEIIDTKLNYPNSALVSLSLNPAVFSSEPSRAYLMKGMYVRVPSNYSASTRVYSGVWNGTFILAVTSNPAWILFDILTSKRYGLGNSLSESQVDKAMLYTIGRYCDEMVSNGFGGTEPRFSINTVIQTRADAYKVISDITSVFRGMAYWNGGMVCLRHDAPAEPSLAFNQANVIGGDFNYASSSRKDRHSVVNVTWNDPQSNYKQRIEYVQDHELIQALGVVKQDTVAFGCTSRGQAHRVGQWILYSERYESNLITFKVGLDASLMLPGEIVRITDAFKAGKRMGGRVLSATTTSVTTDSAISITTGASIFIAMPDGSFIERVVNQSGGDFSTFTWTTALPSLPLANAVFVMSDSSVTPTLARIISVSQDGAEPTQFSVTAMLHNPNKYAAIESGLVLTQPKTSIAQSYVVTVSNVSADETTYFIAPGVIGSKLHLYWEGIASLFRVSYRISINGGGGNWVTMTTTTPTFDIEGLAQGSVVDVKVSARNTLGVWIAPVAYTKTIAGKSAPPGVVTGLMATGDWRSIILKWVNPSDIDFDHVDIYESATDNSATATKIASQYGDTYTRTGLSPSQVRFYWVKAVDTSGNQSAFNTVPGTRGESSVEASFIIDQLQRQVSESALTQDLLEKINQIDLIAEATLNSSASIYNNVNRIDRSLGSVAATVITEQQARVTSEAAFASQISAVQAEVGANSAAVVTEQSARVTADGLLNAQYTVKLNANGHVAGIGVAVSGGADGPISSDIVMLADKFSVVQPTAGPGATPLIPFVVGTVNGVSAVAISNAFIQDAAIDNLKIGAYIQSANYNAASKLGWKIDKNGNASLHSAVFTGTLDIKSATTGARTEIKNDVIKVYDTAGTLRVKLGNLAA